MKTIEEVIARIQKCFSRADKTRGASEAEADTAMRMAQELMLEHNLSMATIEAAGRSHQDAGAVRVKEAFEGKTRFKWQRDLAKYVAEANFCYYLLKEDFLRNEEDIILRDSRGNARTKKSHVFVGRKSNVITAQMMYVYLTQTIEDNAPEDDSRLQLAPGRILSADYKGYEYTIKVLEGGRFERTDFEEPYARGEIYETLSAAGKFIRDGKETNGFVFFGLGAASTAVSWKEGCADRICERLAQKRADLVASHDARVRAEEAAAQADREQQARETSEKAKRVLNKREATTEEILEELSEKAYDFSGHVPGPAPDAPRPDGSDEDEWEPGADATKEPTVAPAAASSALVLASVYDESEREANEELAKGWPVGTFAKWRREAEERRVAREAREAQRTEVPDEEWKPGATVEPETEAQRARRERKQAAEMAAQRKRWAREDARAARESEKQYARIDRKAYSAGAEAGSKIGLDLQIAKASDQKKLGR